MVLTLLRALPGVRDLIVTVACGIVTRRLSASPGAPGPHDFVVRNRFARQTIRLHPSHPASNTRDDREAPLVSRKSGRMCERAFAAQPPVAGTEPVAPLSGRACSRARDSSGVFLNPNSCKGL